jgi:hypothetical protein
MRARMAWGLIVIAVSGCGAPPAAIASDALGIEAMPPSVRHVRCKDWGVTDVLLTCSFDFEAEDLPRLLSGLEWSGEPGTGLSSEYRSGPQVGAEFPVATVYEAKPRWAPYGGLVRLVVDKTGNRALIELYVE